MTLERLEHIFFEDGPSVLRQAGYFLFFVGLVGGIAVVFSSGNGFDPAGLMITAYALIPALLCWMIAWTTARRHIATIPLIGLLCALSTYVCMRDPSAAAEGLSPYTPFLIGVWIAVIVEVLAVIALMAFMLYLWRKGAFS